MLPNKISTLLSEYYGMSNVLNKWIRFNNDISIIYLDQDANIYIGEDQLFFLDTSDGSLNISETSGNRKLDLSGKTSLSDFPVHTKLSMSSIAGFISTSAMAPYGSYQTKKF